MILKSLVRIVGWLLTPLVAWAASFFGAWLMALAGPTFDDSSVGLLLSFAGGATGAITATLLWMRLLRRSPELREALQVTEEGIPVAAVEDEADTGEDKADAVEGSRQLSKAVEGSRRQSQGVEEGH